MRQIRALAAVILGFVFSWPSPCSAGPQSSGLPMFEVPQTKVASWIGKGARGDFDGDGDSDAVACLQPSSNPATHKVLLLKNSGTGTFTSEPSTNVVGGASECVAFRADGDADLDIAVTYGSSTPATITVLLNDGTGQFAPGFSSSLCATSQGLASADVDGDGDIDLAYCCPTFNAIGLLSNDGTGGFSGLGSVTGVFTPYGVTFHDLDGDNDQDLLVANNGSNSLSIRWNNGLGVFATGVTANCSFTQKDIAVADLDADLDLDLVATNPSSGRISILANNGSFAFTLTASKVVGGNPAAPGINDLDSDGDPDISVCEPASGRMVCYLNDSLGSFPTATSHYGGGVQWYSPADFDSDGDTDFLVTGGSTASIFLMRNQGSATFFGPRHFALAEYPVIGRLCDINGDQKVDVVAAAYGSSPPVGTLSTLLGQGNGTFAPVTNITLPFTASGIAAADLDLDGDLDVAIPVQNDDNVLVYLNNGAGVYTSGGVFPAGDAPAQVEARKFDGDGDFDLAISNPFNNRVAILLNNGGAQFSAPTYFSTGATPRALVAGDLDGNGSEDLLVANENSAFATVLKNQGNGTFIAGTNMTVNNPRFFALGDLNNDGRLDAVGSGASGITVNFNLGGAVFSGPTVYPSIGPPAVADVDLDSDLDVLVATDRMLVLFENSGSGVLVGPWYFAGGSSPYCLMSGDIDSSGRPDAVIVGIVGDDVTVQLNKRQIAPTLYCTPKTNSLGCVPAIGSTGFASASSTNGFVITCSQVLNNKNGLLFYGLSGRHASPFQGGTLCIKATIKRAPVVQSGGTPPPNNCTGVFALDMNSFAHGLLGGTPAAGLTNAGTIVDVQWWGRDPGFPAPSNTALSNALEYIVEP